MKQILFLAARTRLPLTFLSEEIQEFKKRTKLGSAPHFETHNFLLWVCAFDGRPREFKQRFAAELDKPLLPEGSDPLFSEYGIGTVHSVPFVRDDLRPDYYWTAFRPLRWTERFQAMMNAQTLSIEPPRRKTKLLLLKTSDKVDGIGKTENRVLKALGYGAQRNWHTDDSALISFSYDSSTESLGASIAKLLMHEFVDDFAAFECGPEYVASRPGLDPLETWLASNEDRGRIGSNAKRPRVVAMPVVEYKNRRTNR